MNSEIIQNFMIGIIGGVFSSSIVSIIFFLINEYQNELYRAKNMVIPLCKLVALGENDEEKLKLMEPVNTREYCMAYYWDALSNFIEYEPWKYKFELGNAMDNLYKILQDKEIKDLVQRGDTDRLSKQLREQLLIIEKCERHFANGLWKRIIHTKIIQGIIVIFLLFVIITVFYCI